MLFTKHDIPHLFLQLVSQDSVPELLQHIMTLPYPDLSRTEFHFCCLLTRFVSQDVVCVHSVGLGGSWTFTDRQCPPSDFVENPHHCRQVLTRLFTKHDFPYLLLQLISQDSAQELFQHIMDLPYSDLSETHGLSFSFVVYGFDLLVKVWFVFVVLV
jgi:hypothetical protein